MTLAAPVLDEVKAHHYDAQVFIDYTRTIIEHMGGIGPATEAAAREILANAAMLIEKPIPIGGAGDGSKRHYRQEEQLHSKNTCIGAGQWQVAKRCANRES